MATEKLTLKITNIPPAIICAQNSGTGISSPLQLVFHMSSDVQLHFTGGAIPTKKGGAIFFRSNIDFWNNNPDSVFSDLSEKLDFLGIESQHHEGLILLLAKSVGDIILRTDFGQNNALVLAVYVTHTRTYSSLKRVKGEQGGKVCSICLEEIGANGASMDCGHVFHSECITKWLDRSEHCPLCRSLMPGSLEMKTQIDWSATSVQYKVVFPGF